MPGPLEGIRIIDLTTVLMGPFATQILADFGADVIKVEPPSGDTVRGIGPSRHGGMGHIFLHVNRNKRSIALDLKRPEGLATLMTLVRDADVLIYNIRPQAMKRLGISYEGLRAINPRLIYAGLYGYSEAGPYAGKPAYDDLIQGAAAVPSLMSRASGGEPRYVPLTLADRTVGLMAANAILAAVVARQRTGEGQSLEVPMFETMAQFVLGDHMGGETFVPAVGPSGYPRLLVQERRPYKTADGYLCVLIYNDRQWQKFLELIGEPERFTTDPRFASIGERTKHINDLYAMVASYLRDNTTAYWLDALERADIPAIRLHDVDSLLRDPHLQQTGFIQVVDHPTEGTMHQVGIPVTLSATPTGPLRPAPRLGEHSAEVLLEAGYTVEQVQDLLDKRAVFTVSAPTKEAA